MNTYATPFKVQLDDTSEPEIAVRRFGRKLEDILKRPPAFQDRVFKTDDGQAVILAVELEEDDLRKMEKHSKDENFTVIERPWEDLLGELADEGNDSFDVNAALL